MSFQFLDFFFAALALLPSDRGLGATTILVDLERFRVLNPPLACKKFSVDGSFKCQQNTYQCAPNAHRVHVAFGLPTPSSVSVIARVHGYTSDRWAYS